MKLSQILSQVKTEYEIIGDLSRLDAIEVEDVTNDSRLVKKNSVFFALSGKQKDGWEFINDAVKSGAAAIVASKEAPGDGYILLKSHEPSQLLAEFLNIFYKPLPANIYAVTGTNGKTSVAEFTRQILQFLGKKSASIGTLGTICEATANKGSEVSSLTTPDIVSLYKNLQTLKQNGVDDVVMEVSSIGLDQGRIADLKIDVAAFTNFTQDHLDYHKSMQDYFASKMLLFKRALKEQGLAVLNSDITEFAEIKKICEEKKHRIIEYGLNAKDLNLKKLEPHGLGQKVFLKKTEKNIILTWKLAANFKPITRFVL